MKNFYFLIIILLVSENLFAQFGSIKGKVTDNSNLPLLGANIIIEGTLIGVATDENGFFNIPKIKNGSYFLTASIVGFTKFKSELIQINNNSFELNIKLTPTSYQFDQLIISANKFGQDLRGISSSSYILDSKIFAEKNYQKVDDAFRYVPGITMTQDQISIRGSSGYSRGAGTRVLVAIDGIPVYTPDTGEIIWELIPVNEIERIEILKGSSSSLYGSSAIGGIINIITNKISTNPLTLVKLEGGIYSNPSHDEWKWTDKTLSFNRQSISHSRLFGNLNLSASLSRFEDLSYRKNDNQIRYSAFLKADYNFSENTSLSFWGTGYTREKSTFIYWKDLQNALVPADADLGQSINSDRTIFGLKFNHIYNENLSISFVPSAYISFWKDQSESSNKSSSQLYRNELRINYKFSDEINLVSGVEHQYNKVGSTIFGNRSSNSFGIFSQLDFKLFERLNLSTGLRYDHSKLENLDNENSLSPKIGLNYKIDDNTFIRASFGKGFRTPSLAEAFTSTTTSGVTVKPNPNLNSESSLSFETGINTNILDPINIDFAIFNNEYFEMIEPSFDSFGDIIFKNLTRARIQGFEIVSATKLFSENLSLKFGYNYLWAIDIENNEFLKYRPKNSVIAGIDFKKDFVESGIDFRYLSRVEKIDNEFVDLGLVPDGDKRVEIFVIDARVGVNLFQINLPGRIFFSISNLLNYNYVELIGNLAPVRNFSLSTEFIF
ncbi:MAG: TonB-dependent receptor [Ignavibacteriae bacterium]|nr:TonB-dependent receptor [Ignavibacteriota bacterium]